MADLNWKKFVEEPESKLKVAWVLEHGVGLYSKEDFYIQRTKPKDVCAGTRFVKILWREAEAKK